MTPLFGSGRKPTLRFEYRALAPSGLIDQCLSIHNRTTAPVVLAARVAMCDSLGQPLPEVTVRSVNDSLEGGQVLVPGENVDFLSFPGPGAELVRSVQVQVDAVEEVAFPEVRGVVEVVPCDGLGNETRAGDSGLEQLALVNHGMTAVPVRVRALAMGQPPPGQPQQVVHVLDLVGLVTAPPGTSYVALPEEVRAGLEQLGRQQWVSVKAAFAR
jgi:hypothetical protein